MGLLGWTFMMVASSLSSSSVTTNDKWSFSIPKNTVEELQVPSYVVDSFQSDGFAVFPRVLDNSTVQALNKRLEHVLRGHYDREQSPDKIPRLLKSKFPAENNNIGPLGFSGNLQNNRVLQIINIHKADSEFRKVVSSPLLGKVVASLAGWKEGARLAQDQVWAKPPQSPALAFHRDSPYFMFTPSDVMTVWIALDTMDEELGPLEYVRGSHKWGDGRVGSASHFFTTNNNLLQSAAEREGINQWEIVSMTGLQAGGISIHDGRTWHGSGKNQSLHRPRRGIGLHFVPAKVRFTADAAQSSLWKRYVENVEDPSLIELSNDDFPVTWTPHMES